MNINKKITIKWAEMLLAIENTFVKIKALRKPKTQFFSFHNSVLLFHQKNFYSISTNKSIAILLSQVY